MSETVIFSLIIIVLIPKNMKRDHQHGFRNGRSPRDFANFTHFRTSEIEKFAGDTTLHLSCSVRLFFLTQAFWQFPNRVTIT